jgi:hypothetical protein
MPRPKSTPADLASERISVYLTAEQKAQLDERRGCLSMSEYLLQAGLNRKRAQGIPEINRQVYVELGKIERTLNQIARACDSLARQGRGFPLQEQRWFSSLRTQLQQIQQQMIVPPLQKREQETKKELRS